MVKLKELLKEDLITERKLTEFDKARVEESLKRLNKFHADLNKLWPQIQKSTAKTKWKKAKDAAYGLSGLGKNLYRYLDEVEDILKRPASKDDDEQENMLKLKDLLNEKTVPMGQVHSNPYASSFKSSEQIKEDGHTDVPSAIRKLKTSIEDCQDILKKLEGMEEESLPSWWTDKITLASNYLNKARDYLLNTEET